jgi:voltage-gated potassium channel
VIGSIIIGALLTVVTVGIHALGTAWWIGRLKRVTKTARGVRRRLLPLRVLCSTALLLLLLHIVEVAPWASAYMLLPNIDSLNTFEEATYFATVTFASLGYGDIVISGPWRLLSAIQAMNGLLVFGWSTALLFAVVERIWGAEDVPGEETDASPSVLALSTTPDDSSSGRETFKRTARLRRCRA